MASKSTGTGKEPRGKAGSVRGLSDTAKARGGKTIGTPKSGAAAAMAGSGRAQLDKGHNPRSGVKAIGGGLSAGSTDFASPPEAWPGGRGGSRGGAARSSEIG